jgi:O-antigen ligase
LFILVGLFTVFILATKVKLFSGKNFWIPFLLFAWGLVGMLLGLSRSFWFGGFVGALLMVFLLLWRNNSRELWKRMLLIAPLGLVMAVAVIFITYTFPYPTKTGDMSLASLLSGRAFSITGEAAANSRWALLPELWQAGLRHPILGSGLGTEVTYKTSDPRLLADNPSGEYTTYAFEWGYHDLWVKFGLLGLAIYGWFIIQILKPFFVSLKNRKGNTVIIISLLAGVVAILATNVFSPYLNHPLGIGLLMLTAAIGVGNRIEFGLEE